MSQKHRAALEEALEHLHQARIEIEKQGSPMLLDYDEIISDIDALVDQVSKEINKHKRVLVLVPGSDKGDRGEPKRAAQPYLTQCHRDQEPGADHRVGVARPDYAGYCAAGMAEEGIPEA